MSIGIYLTGAFGPSQELYKKRNEAKRGRGTLEAVEEQIKEDGRSIIKKQQDSQCDYITDPQYRFYDLFQPFVENISGIEPGPQENWFNNNVFYRIPVITGPLKSQQQSFFHKYLDMEALLSAKQPMAILPSPLTFYLLSNVDGYLDERDAIKDIATIIANEAQDLVKRGIKRIQFDEPALAMMNGLKSITPNHLSLLEEGLETIGKISGATTSLNTYFGDISTILTELIRLPVDCIGIDCAEITTIDHLKNCSFQGKELALGLVDARTPVMEDPKELYSKIQSIIEVTNPSKVWLTPNTGLEYIGWTLGKEKIEILEQVKKIGSKAS